MGFARYHGCTIIKIIPTQPETWLNAGIPTMDMPSVWFSISINQCIGHISILATHLVENMGMLPMVQIWLPYLFIDLIIWTMLTYVDWGWPEIEYIPVYSNCFQSVFFALYHWMDWATRVLDLKVKLTHFSYRMVPPSYKLVYKPH